MTDERRSSGEESRRQGGAAGGDEVRRSCIVGMVVRAADVLFFAPIGFASEATHLIPELAAKGRERFRSAATTLWDTGRMLTNLPDSLGLRPPEDQSATSVVEFAARSVGASRSVGTRRGRRFQPPGRTGNAGSSDPGVDVEELAIPDYDSLSASQVVPLLAGLTTEELEAVRRYERTHRGRRTILARIDQLIREAS
ncbi:MAG: hypothetical protein KatS3mg008_0275 [Acidimicrobiales bacterium]|nr:MAG: hypothetical protein KatS3mg008_0275 [Acidimicrobiales bacterium]